MYAVEVNPADPKSVDTALRTEWLLTNGLGGYAMSTVLGVNTRRYHGLLVAATKPPVGRVVSLHSVIEQLIVPREDGTDEIIALSTQQFVRGDGSLMLHPGGWRWLRRFEVDIHSHAAWTFQVGGMTVVRELFLSDLQNRAFVSYDFTAPSPGARLRLRPMSTLRDFHALAREHGVTPMVASADDSDVWCLLRPGDEDVSLFARGAAWRTDTQWWRNFAYAGDRDRGQDFVEDVWSPGEFEAMIGPDLLSVTIEATAFGCTTSSCSHHSHVNGKAPPQVQSLQAAASQFVVRRSLPSQRRRGVSVIAGYPWFGDWGRDTMIALPGLMLCTGRQDEARSTIECFAKHLHNGLIPNLFDDYGGAAHYNTVDASLWFIHAVHAYTLATSGDKSSAHHPSPDPLPQGSGGSVSADLFAACREIIAAYRRGTDFGIRMGADGLIAAGNEATQLTWMDAARDGVVFTPRHGKAVEINALWHNALVCLSEMTSDASERNDLLMLARRVAASFRSAFWWDEMQCLHDCLVPGRGGGASGDGNATAYASDRRLRPNQILAVSLPFSPLHEMQQRAVVKIVGERLLTPFGLRTLDRDDPDYQPRYEGNLFQRDAAYHNGTVWPWLIGPYCEALLRVEKFSDEAKQRVRGILQPLLDEMNNASGGRCLGQIAEVYDAEPPHRPSGCPAQAWSVAEVLRVLTMLT